MIPSSAGPSSQTAESGSICVLAAHAAMQLDSLLSGRQFSLRPVASLLSSLCAIESDSHAAAQFHVAGSPSAALVLMRAGADIGVGGDFLTALRELQELVDANGEISQDRIRRLREYCLSVAQNSISVEQGDEDFGR